MVKKWKLVSFLPGVGNRFKTYRATSWDHQSNNMDFSIKMLLYFGPFFVWFLCGVIFIESNLVEQVPREPHTVCRGATCPIFSELHWHVFARKKWYMAHLFLLSQNNFFLNQAASSIPRRYQGMILNMILNHPFPPSFTLFVPFFFKEQCFFLGKICFMSHVFQTIKAYFWKWCSEAK